MPSLDTDSYDDDEVEYHRQMFGLLNSPEEVAFRQSLSEEDRKFICLVANIRYVDENTKIPIEKDVLECLLMLRDENYKLDVSAIKEKCRERQVPVWGSKDVLVIRVTQFETGFYQPHFDVHPTVRQMYYDLEDESNN